jgi:hypothetical protein
MGTKKGSTLRHTVPVLEGWLSIPVAAKRLGVSRQRVFQMPDEEPPKLTQIYQIPGEKERPAAYVVSEKEVNELIAKMREEAERKARVAADAVPVP